MSKLWEPTPPTALCCWQWLTCILNSVGDKKYLRADEDHKTLAHNVLTKFGASPTLAQKVQVICLGVSYSSEIQDLQYVQSLIAQHPYVFPEEDPAKHTPRTFLWDNQLS
jgi:hypothetical protein